MTRRELDLVLFGATGFVGRLVAGYLAAAAPGGTRIGLAGRSLQRLAEVRDSLGAPAASWPLLPGDLADPRSLAELAHATRVLASAAGPYDPLGLPLVGACVDAGTDYADLTGEVLFVRASIDRYHAAARARGTRIVHCCGIDSIPSDLGVLLLSERARADGAGALEETLALVRAFRGGFSGGTLATMRRQLERTRSDAACRRVVADPYALSPDRAHEPDLGEQRDLRGIEPRRDLGVWLGRFVMAGINTRVVRRSNALLGWAYGKRFHYREVSAFENSATGLLRAATASGGYRLLEAFLTRPPLRSAVDRLLPSSGEGPGERRRSAGRFEMEIHTRTAGGGRYLACIAAAGDPGYTAGSLMLAESALCLLFEHERQPIAGGVLTPATAMGAPLVGRLRAAGLELQTRSLELEQ